MMNKIPKKQRSTRIPTECNRTAAWANIEKKEPDSGVAIPSESEVENAKEYVDGNEKW